MATLYITEFEGIVGDQTERVQATKFPALTTQTVSIAGSSAASSAFHRRCSVVRVATDVGCHIECSTNPTATTSSTYLPAYTVEYFGVKAGDKIAVIES